VKRRYVGFSEIIAMRVPRVNVEPLPHAAFLSRLGGGADANAIEARLGQGAFLTLRLVDLLRGDRAPPHPDAFHYQHLATERFCRDLESGLPEETHLKGLVRTAADAFRLGDARLIVPALLAYALFLEDDARSEEAIDVLETTLRTGGDRLPVADAVAATLRLARVNRKLARFEEAEAAYGRAGHLAMAGGDGYSVLLSRIGLASAMQGRGNLAEAERCWREILDDARIAGERDAEAQAEHGLGTTLLLRGQPAEAAPHAWRASELYENEPAQLRALGDLAFMLLALGDAESAERALGEVVRRSGHPDVVLNVVIELMHCASYRRDRVGFERWRGECEGRLEHMAPNMVTDFLLKLGIGHARFGNFRQAETFLTAALETATANGLHEFEFRIERIRNGLGDCRQELAKSCAEAAEPVTSKPLRQVRDSLRELAGAGA
jgi:tetratricopeptide (TPR) repeat protein